MEKSWEVLSEKYAYMLGNGKWGFECDIGWYDLLDDLMNNIMSKDPDREIRVLQIKEKFGTLRFYIGSGTDEIFDMIDEAERRSELICEMCGKESNTSLIKGDGWCYNRCDECWDKIKNK